jgi:tRNA-dihydrouridine synthase
MRIHKEKLLSLLLLHLDLYDEWQPQLLRPFETLKRFFKIYVRDFAGASELREKLMHTTTTHEVRELIKKAA